MRSTSDWSPTTYLKFEDERTRPARDLLAQVRLTTPRSIVDVGCGPGNSTELLVARYPDADVVGLDTSQAMLEEARRRVPGTRFETADAKVWRPGSAVNLVFANAVYQWIPDHLDVLAGVLEAMAEGATLAVQMPDNLTEPTHVLMKAVARGGAWAERLAGAARDPLPPVLAYYDAFKPHSRRLEIWHTVYNHVLDGPEAIVEWVRGTGLKPFLDPLDAVEKAAYLAEYTRRIAEAYPLTADGKAILRFPRLFLVAER